jgi:hypothetical protein
MTDDRLPPPDDPQNGEDKSAVITVNFKEGTIVNKVQFENEGGIPKFLRDLAKFSRQNKVKSVVVMTIDEDNYVDWVHIADSEYHLALAALCLDDIRDDLKAVIFDDGEEE